MMFQDKVLKVLRVVVGESEAMKASAIVLVSRLREGEDDARRQLQEAAWGPRWSLQPKRKVIVKVTVRKVALEGARKQVASFKKAARAERVEVARARRAGRLSQAEPHSWRLSHDGLQRRAESRLNASPEGKGALRAREIRQLERIWQEPDVDFEGAKGDVHKARSVKVWSARGGRFVTWSFSIMEERWLPSGVYERIGIQALETEIEKAHGYERWARDVLEELYVKSV